MPNPSTSGELVGEKLGKYKLLSLIAVGGTAEIYLARISGASGFEKYLVVKSLLDHLADDPDFVKMFLDEARMSAQLDHSNIVQTLELGEHKGRYFLVMEYLAGMSLAQIARKTQERHITGGLINTNLVLGLAAQTCNGLHYAHNKKLKGTRLNLVHRDISPQNLVVSYEGVLKIVDFGIAKSDIRESRTKTGTIKGKFAYMSPEQCLSKDVDHRTDIFALGTLCHELLTGRRLFKRSTTYDTYQAVISGKIPRPSQVNKELDSGVDDLVMKALAYKPEDRYQSAQEFGDAILTLLHARNGSGGPSDVARFFDEYFYDDLQEHAQQMRELISGQVDSKVDGTWDSELIDISAPSHSLANRTPKPRSGQAKGNERSKDLSSIPTIRPPATLPTGPDPDEDASDDDEGPTRIVSSGDEMSSSNPGQGGRHPTEVTQTLNEPEKSAPTASSVGANPIEPFDDDSFSDGGATRVATPSAQGAARRGELAATKSDVHDDYDDDDDGDRTVVGAPADMQFDSGPQQSLSSEIVTPEPLSTKRGIGDPPQRKEQAPDHHPYSNQGQAPGTGYSPGLEPGPGPGPGPRQPYGQPPGPGYPNPLYPPPQESYSNPQAYGQPPDGYDQPRQVPYSQSQDGFRMAAPYTATNLRLIRKPSTAPGVHIAVFIAAMAIGVGLAALARFLM